MNKNKMNHKKITKSVLMLTLTLIMLPITLFATVITVDPNQVVSIYEYENFSNVGSAFKIYNPTTDSYTIRYGNVTVTGYYGTDGTWIVTERVYLYANGRPKLIEDVINQTYKEFDPAGKLTAAWTVGPNGEKYTATIKHNPDGSYEITWKGVIDEDGDPNTTDDQEVVEDAKVEHYRPDGRLEWTKTKTCYTTSTTYMIYDSAGNLQRAETYDDNGTKIAVLHYTLGRPDYAESYDPNSGKWYKSAQYHYEGEKLVCIENYSHAGDGKSKLESTTYFDEHGRVDHVTDSQGRVISKNYWNDTSQTQTYTIDTGDEQITVNVQPGGLLYTEEYVYDDDAGLKKTYRTYYHNGNPNLPAVKYAHDIEVTDIDKYNNWLKEQAPNIKTETDPNITGKLYIDQNGYVILEVTDEQEYNEMIDALNKAIDECENSEMKAELEKIRDNLKNQWETTGKVKLRVGAVNTSRGHDRNGNESGVIGETDPENIWNDALMKNIINKADNGETATLTWNLWAIDSAVNVWMFATEAS